MPTLVPGRYVIWGGSLRSTRPDWGGSLRSARPGWGIGQVQSAVGPRVTVNFEHAGKQLINAEVVTLVEIALDSQGRKLS